MKLRDRLLLFSTAQLLVFGALFALAYGAFERSIVPMFESLIAAKTERVARMVSGELDTALGSDDRTVLARAVTGIVDDPDFAYLAVRDSHDGIVFSQGKPPRNALFDGTEQVAHTDDGRVLAWASIHRDGLRIGSVAVAFSTARFDAIAEWAKRIAVCVTLAWLAALIYSILFARTFVTPIRSMMDFSRKVAGGALSERLATEATGELRELRDYLNQMTADLERREAERKAAATRAEEMQNELLSVSRMAGMAEIATGVLHNVGNVLNSLNISVSMISDQVRASRVSGLTRSIELVDSFPGGLPAFLETEKGKVLPTYLSSVSRRLSEENAKMLDELASVNRHVDHIKTIVAMQQSYARPSGINELVALGPLIDDALHMGESSFAKHGIEVIKDYSDDITIATDRHKLLQIMINLISNARHALKDLRAKMPDHRGPQHLIVRVRSTPTAIMIAVADTGVGIPAENLEKIFRHGFTTKQGGHGFGLHASANAARELGGSLHVASDGPGTGATFTLEVPLAANEREHDVRN
ncbi:MAG TPA: ATP-binding protein [Kofleriaceae bacterium]|nr:ATP-binding protein [Kofleriaceae bacterium]